MQNSSVAYQLYLSRCPASCIVMPIASIAIPLILQSFCGCFRSEIVSTVQKEFVNAFGVSHRVTTELSPRTVHLASTAQERMVAAREDLLTTSLSGERLRNRMAPIDDRSTDTLRLPKSLSPPITIRHHDNDFTTSSTSALFDYLDQNKVAFCTIVLFLPFVQQTGYLSSFNSHSTKLIACVGKAPVCCEWSISLLITMSLD